MNQPNITTPRIGAPVFAAENCPLCGGRNNCQHCFTNAGKGPCWCMTANIPDELLARVSAAARNQACLCAACVAAAMDAPAPGGDALHRVPSFPGKIEDAVERVPTNLKEPETSSRATLPGDFYFEAGGLRVFTAAYHQRRGYCCGSGCRHCPYPEAK